MKRRQWLGRKVAKKKKEKKDKKNTCEEDSKPETPSIALETPNKMAVIQLPSTALPPTITLGNPCVFRRPKGVYDKRLWGTYGRAQFWQEWRYCTVGDDYDDHQSDNRL